jgi:hypothetical protein
MVLIGVSPWLILVLGPCSRHADGTERRQSSPPLGRVLPILVTPRLQLGRCVSSHEQPRHAGCARSVNAVEYTREWVVETLRRARHYELAEEARRSLPERLSEDELWRFAAMHNITRDMLISEMGGSP